MPISLSNAPNMFMRLMNQVFWLFLNELVVVYFDSILIYNSSLEGHTEHLGAIFALLTAQQLFANIKKCHFMAKNISFLMFVVPTKGISVDFSKVEAILSWSIPHSFTEVCQFLGLASFYHCFAPNFSLIIASLTKILRN